MLRRYRELVRLARREGFGPFLSRRRTAERTTRPGRRPPAARARGGRRRLREARPDRGHPRRPHPARGLRRALVACRTGWRRRRRKHPACARGRARRPRSTRCSPSSTGSPSRRHPSDRRTRARLQTGEAVVVKVQRPGIDDVIERDLAALALLANVAQRRTTFGQGLRSGELLAQFAVSLRPSSTSATRPTPCSRCRCCSARDSSVRVPRVHRSTARDDCWCRSASTDTPSPTPPAIDAPGSTARCSADELLRTTLEQILRIGLFHADPHPGNIFAFDDGSLGLIDFGAVGRLDPIQQSAVIDMLAAFVRRDVGLLRDGDRTGRRNGRTPSSRAARTRARPAPRRPRASDRRRRALRAAGSRRHCRASASGSLPTSSCSRARWSPSTARSACSHRSCPWCPPPPRR